MSNYSDEKRERERASNEKAKIIKKKQSDKKRSGEEKRREERKGEKRNDNKIEKISRFRLNVPKKQLLREHHFIPCLASPRNAVGNEQTRVYKARHFYYLDCLLLLFSVRHPAGRPCLTYAHTFVLVLHNYFAILTF